MRDFLLQFFIDNPAFLEWLGILLVSVGAILIVLLVQGYGGTLKLAVLTFVVAVLLSSMWVVTDPLPTQYLSQFASPCFDRKAREHLTKYNRQLTLGGALKIRQRCLVEESIWPDAADL